MDGKALLMVFVALCGAGYFLSTEDITLGGNATGPSEPPRRLAAVIDLRHNTIEGQLARDGHDTSDPNSFIFDRLGASIVGGPIAATEHGTAMFTRDLFPWYVYPGVTDQPSRLDEIAMVESCTPSAPAAGSRVAHVFSGPTLQRVSVFAYDHADLDHLARAHLDKIRQEGVPRQPSLVEMFSTGEIQGASLNRKVDPFQFTLMNVVVTETETPVHLVLEAGTGRVLWNLSFAPGANVTGVTLLGGTKTGIANLPRRTEAEAMTEAELAACNLLPARRPLPSDPIFSAVAAEKLSLSEARTLLEPRIAAAERWNEWFEARFGVRADAIRIGHDQGSIAAVIGPIPQTEAEKVGFHGFSERVARITPADGTIVTEPTRAEGRLNLRIEKRAKELAGTDDLASLHVGAN